MTSVETSDVRPAHAASPPGPGRAGGAVVLPLALWATVVGVGALLVHVVLVATGTKRLNGVPLHATFDPYVGWRTLVPIAIVAGVVLINERLRRVTWRRFLGAWWLVTLLWSVTLAITRNPRRFTSPLEHRGEYLAAVPEITSVGRYLETFVDRIATFPVHVQGHPPGFVLVADALDALGARGSLPLAALVVVVGGAAVPCTLVAVRDVVDEQWARAAAPFLAIGPAAIWIATTADAFYTGVGAAAVALVVCASSRVGSRRLTLAVSGGVGFGVCVMLSYGLVLLGAIPLVVLCARRAFDVLVAAWIGSAAVLAAFAIAGFWWVDGLFATRERYFAGIASDRPYWLFVVANVSMLFLALGPAIVVAVWRLRDRSCWLLVGGALLALALADLSGMSKSEVERIWLPFMPWVVLSAGGFASRAAPRSLRTLGGPSGWLVLQGGSAIVLESVVRTAW